MLDSPYEVRQHLNIISKREVSMINPVQQIEALHWRLQKARELVADGKVHPIIGVDDHYAVQSSKGHGFYLVNGVCGCPDAQRRSEMHHGWCKHKLAVELVKGEQADQTDDFSTPEAA